MVVFLNERRLTLLQPLFAILLSRRLQPAIGLLRIVLILFLRLLILELGFGSQVTELFHWPFGSRSFIAVICHPASSITLWRSFTPTVNETSTSKVIERALAGAAPFTLAT